MPYLDFVSDEHLLNCINELYNVYVNCQEKMTLKKFYSNKVDPIKFNFDTKFNDISIEQCIINEISRQNDKTINNQIGTFHEELLGGISGFEKKSVGFGYDVRKIDNTIFAEIKNKHNTVKGENLKDIHNKLSEIANNNPNATCYFVQIIAKKSLNEVWKITSKGVIYEHERVKIISADNFYEIATGNPNAFKELCDILPRVANDFKEFKATNEEVVQDRNDIFNIIEETSSENNTDVLTQILRDTFSTYKGF